MQDTSIELVSFPLCPYVQRSVITLLEKDITFKRTYISLSNKPDWFMKLAPTGKVPALVINNRDVLFESAVICEYLDEITPGKLLPEAPLLKAKQKAWIEFGSSILAKISGLYNATTKQQYLEILQQLRLSFERLESMVGLPFFSGDKFQMIDAVFATIFRYFEVFASRIRLTLFDNLPNIDSWRKNLANRPSVQMAVHDNYADDLLKFVEAKQSYLSQCLQE